MPLNTINGDGSGWRRRKMKYYTPSRVKSHWLRCPKNCQYSQNFDNGISVFTLSRYCLGNMKTFNAYCFDSCRMIGVTFTNAKFFL